MAYAVSPPFAKIAFLMQMDDQQREAQDWRRSLERTIQTIAGLTAVDGATLITENYDVLAFGARRSLDATASRRYINCSSLNR